MKRSVSGLIFLAFAMVAPQAASGQSTCPPEITVEQKASAPDSNWTVTYSGYKTAVAGVTIFDGPPAEQASLVPDTDKTTESTVIQTWRLLKSNRGYWLQCQYANTTAQIYQRLPANVSRCDVTYERNVFFGGGGSRVVKSVKCK
jgi:hypothetical protein